MRHRVSDKQKFLTEIFRPNFADQKTISTHDAEHSYGRAQREAMQAVASPFLKFEPYFFLKIDVYSDKTT